MKFFIMLCMLICLFGCIENTESKTDILAPNITEIITNDKSAKSNSSSEESFDDGNDETCTSGVFGGC